MKKLFNDFHDWLFKKLNRKLDVKDFITIFVIMICFSHPSANVLFHVLAWVFGINIVFNRD